MDPRLTNRKNEKYLELLGNKIPRYLDIKMYRQTVKTDSQDRQTDKTDSQDRQTVKTDRNKT